MLSFTFFSEKNELLRFAKDFLSRRTTSLENDVKRCLALGRPFDDHSQPAAFPAIMYCFSTIDLLGALYKGDATKNANTTQQSADYMKQFMFYTDEETRLLQHLFRHKIVHLAEPNAVINDNDRFISWAYCHAKHDKHLKLAVEPSIRANREITSRIRFTITHRFTISITHFQRDICESVQRPNGYLATLEKEPELQRLFDIAVGQIYNPKEPKKKCP